MLQKVGEPLRPGLDFRSSGGLKPLRGPDSCCPLPTPSLSSVFIPTFPIIFSLVLLAQSSDSEGTTQLHPHWGGFHLLAVCQLGLTIWPGDPRTPVPTAIATSLLPIWAEEAGPPEAYPRTTLWQGH